MPMERTESAEVQSTVHCMSTDVDEKVVSSTHSVGVDIWRSENGNTWRDLSGVGEYNGERHAGDGDKQWGGGPPRWATGSKRRLSSATTFRPLSGVAVVHGSVVDCQFLIPNPFQTFPESLQNCNSRTPSWLLTRLDQLLI